MSVTPTPDEREAWQRNAARAKAAARARLETAMQTAFPPARNLPDPIADALRRAEEAIANVRQEAPAK